MHPITLALLGILAYRTYQGKGKIAEWIGHQGPDAQPASASAASTPSQQLPPLLQSLGAAPLADGLRDLLKDFQEKGFGETMKSWVETGSNKTIAAPDVEKALGAQKIEWLMQQTGMTKEQLLEGLSRELPSTVDALTPDGKLPEQGTTQTAQAQTAYTKYPAS